MSGERLAGPRPAVPSYGAVVPPPSYDAAAPRYGQYATSGDARNSAGATDDFEGKSRKISSQIFKINSNATSLERLSKNIGGREDDSSFRRKIHELQQDTNKIAANVADQLKQVPVGSDRGRKLQVERLSQSFQEAVQRYCNIQKKTAEKLRASIMTSETGNFGSEAGSEYGHVGGDDDRRALVEGRRAQLQAQALLVEDDLAAAVDRAERLRVLEADILDVNSIFRDLSTMINAQGDVIDSIEANVTKAADNVEGGNVQLVQAAKYQKSARKKMCCLVLILLIIVAIIAIVLGVTLSKK